MILYKYLSAKSAVRILSENNLWFSVTSMLNDPFETKAGKGHPHFDRMLGEFSRNQVIDQNYRVLCLTRDPLSSIMWSHYADEHRGMVIGIDTVLAGLEDPATCVLPAQFGSMIYTRTRPTSVYGEKNDLPKGYAKAVGYDHKLLQFLQRNFLYKSSEWSYEEEVRIIKSANSLNKKINIPDEVDEFDWPHMPSGAIYAIPNDAICEIYLGARFYEFDEDQMSDILNFIVSSAPGATLYDAYPDDASWRMKAAKITSWSQHLRELFHPS